MKSKGLIVTLIILLVIVIALLIGFLVLCLNGTISFNGGFKIFSGKKSDNIIYNEQYNIEDVNAINLSQKAGDIIFENIDENVLKVEVYGETKDDAQISLENNELRIEYKNTNSGFFNFNSVRGDIKIFAPSSFVGKIRIKNDAGETKIQNFENTDIDLDCDAGNVKIDKVKNVNVKCDAGNVEIGTILNQCNMKMNCGNLKVDEMNLNADSNVEADMGNIRIKRINDVYVDAKADLGRCNIGKSVRSSSVTLRVDCDMGNIDIE